MNDQTRKNLAIGLGIASVGTLAYFAYKRFSAPAYAAQVPVQAPAVISADDPIIQTERRVAAREAWMDQQIAKRRADEAEAASRGITAYQVEQERLRREYQQRLQAAGV